MVNQTDRNLRSAELTDGVATVIEKECSQSCGTALSEDDKLLKVPCPRLIARSLDTDTPDDPIGPERAEKRTSRFLYFQKTGTICEARVGRAVLSGKTKALRGCLETGAHDRCRGIKIPVEADRPD